MRRSYTLWKANAIAFASSFCVMVIELIASRILAPHIGVSLYTWTSIIGTILAGIAIGNYCGGKIADRRASPLTLAAIFSAGALTTLAILPATKAVTYGDWFGTLPLMLDFILKVSCIFLVPATILSMVSPVVIKLTLADLGQTGGVVGTIYAFSTAGSILGTFMTGFYFILWFGTLTIVWLVAGVLLLIGISAWFAWKLPGKRKINPPALSVGTMILVVVLGGLFLYRYPESWQQNYLRESNYYTIQVWEAGDGFRGLGLDHMTHAFVIPNEPLTLKYNYLKVFREIVDYLMVGKPAPRVIHLGGGGYSFPRYVEAAYPGSVNEVIEIDPAVTQVAYEYLGLPLGTSIKTYNQDARLFLIQRVAGPKYNVVAADVFSDCSTPYQLTTLEFDRIVKANMERDGVYLLNIIDDYKLGNYMPSIIHTLKQTFDYVYLFGANPWEYVGTSTFVIAATDRRIDLADFSRSITEGGKEATSNPHDEAGLLAYVAKREPVLLTDDYAPTDILVAWLQRGRRP